MKKNLKRVFSFKEGELKGGWFLLNVDKYKSGKKKGQYKYLQTVPLEWGKHIEIVPTKILKQEGK